MAFMISLCSVVTSGVQSFCALAQKLSDMGRPSHVVVNKACQSASDFDFTFITVSGLDRMKEFDELMNCACQSCIPCLQRAGKLIAGFKAFYWQTSPFCTLR